MAPWVELAKVQHSDGPPSLIGSGRFRQVDSETELVMAPIPEQNGAPVEGHWGFQFRDGLRVLADYPSEQEARDALAGIVDVRVFTVQGADSEPEPAADSASEKKPPTPRKPRSGTA